MPSFIISFNCVSTATLTVDNAHGIRIVEFALLETQRARCSYQNDSSFARKGTNTHLLASYHDQRRWWRHGLLVCISGLAYTSDHLGRSTRTPRLRDLQYSSVTSICGNPSGA
jgi:hypothetical protein